MSEAELELLQGLGPKSSAALREVGITTHAELKQLGSVRVLLKLKRECTSMKPSLNFLYALEGAIQGVHWQEIRRTEKGRLLLELEAQRELEGLLGDDDGN